MKNKILISIIFSICLFWYTYGEELNLSKSDNIEYVPWEVIVKYKDTSSNSKLSLRSTKNSLNINAKLESNNLEIKDNLDNLGNIALVEIKDEKTVEETINLLNEDPNIEYAEPNYIRYLFSDSESDTRRNEQWWLNYINWDNAYSKYSWFLDDWTWVIVWVIDNWVNYNHPDLYNSMWNPENWKCKMKIENNIENVDCVHWYDFLHSTPTPLPNLSSHWTHVAGIIAATINNWKWIIWVNPHAKIAALKVWNWSTLTTYAEIQAIDFAIRNWIKIINASYWAYGSWTAEAQALRQYMDFWGLFVTAAWNDYKKDIDNMPEYKTYPCMYDYANIICVASIDNNWKLSAFSNYWKKSVDIAAPWKTILSTSIEDAGVSTWIYDNDFETDDWRWTWWEYHNRWDDTYAYGFYWELKSPSIGINWKDFVYISFSLACASRGVDVELQYSTWLWYSTVNVIPWVYNMWYYYTIPVENEYYSDTFSFWLKTSKTNTYCVIDDFSIYQDPYYESDIERYTFMDWTSMATPHVAWLASLVWTINPGLSYMDVKNLILNNWKESEELFDLTVSWKIIDVEKTLDAATKMNVQSISWLYSSRTWNINWDNMIWIDKFYFEVLSWDTIIKSWYTEWTSVETNLTWDYTRRIQWLDKFWNKSDFSTWYICKKPVLNNISLSWYECSELSENINYQDNCSDYYQFIFTYNNEITWISARLNNSWVLQKEFYIKNLAWEESDHKKINYERKDSTITIEKTSYKHTKTITSSSQQNIWNVVSIFWVKDWICWEKSIIIKSVSCTKWKISLNWKSLLITAESNQQWTSECNIIFGDDEWNEVTWIFKYDFNTIQQSNWWWGWWWWGWWGWGWWGWSQTNQTNTNLTSTNNQKTGVVVTWKQEKIVTWKNEVLVLEKDRKLELYDEKNNESNNSFDFSWFNNSNPSSLLLNWYTVEFNNAYEFAHRAWITTTSSIEKANMNWNLTRIAMAKMLSQYAINILWKKTQNITTPVFPDVSQKLDDDYWWAVELSYQLWIMWKWIKKFRPKDPVTRAEFATALSRMLYWTEDWTSHYYSTHISKLYNEWIINNTNPQLKELRWYVMIMLMRSAKN